MTQTLPPSVQARVDVVMTQLRAVDMSDGQRWHVENAVINATREAMAQARTAGRLEGAGKALRYLLHATGKIMAPDLSRMTPLEAFGWGKALCETALIMIGAQIDQGRLTLGPAADPQKLDDILPDFSDLVEPPAPPATPPAPATPQSETEGKPA